MLGLCGGVDQKFAIIAKFLEPSGNVCGLIRNDCARDSGFGAQVSGSHFRTKLLFGVDAGTERSGITDPFSRKAFLTTGALHLMPISA